MRSARPKYHQARLLLRTPLQIERAMAALMAAPLDPAKPLEFLIREEVKERKLTQQGYYWIRMGEIAGQAWVEGRQFSADLWHEYMKRNVMPDEVATKDGELRSKWTELPDGTVAVISTTELERACFADFTTAVEAFGANLGVHYSANQREAR